MEVGPSAAPMMPMEVEAQQDRDDDGQEDTGLSSGAAQEQLGVGQQRTEVDHGADADEQQDGHSLTGLNADLKQPVDDTGGLAQRLAVLIDNTGQGQVDQDGAEAHGHQQRGLKSLLDGQVDQHRAHHIHNSLLPCDGEDAAYQKRKIHVISSLYVFLFCKLFGTSLHAIYRHDKIDLRSPIRTQVWSFQAKPEGHDTLQDCWLCHTADTVPTTPLSLPIVSNYSLIVKNSS